MRCKAKYKMNEIINKFLLAGDKFMPEMHLNNPNSLIVLVDRSLKTKEEFKTIYIQTIFTKMNLVKLVFSMIWLMEVLKI